MSVDGHRFTWRITRRHRVLCRHLGGGSRRRFDVGEAQHRIQQCVIAVGSLSGARAGKPGEESVRHRDGGQRVTEDIAQGLDIQRDGVQRIELKKRRSRLPGAADVFGHPAAFERIAVLAGGTERMTRSSRIVAGVECGHGGTGVGSEDRPAVHRCGTADQCHCREPGQHDE